MKIRSFTFNPFGENCYLAWDDAGTGVIVDPGCYDASEEKTLTDAVSSENVNIAAILLTHGHFDHVYGVKSLAERYNVNVYMRSADKVILDGDALFAGSFGLRAPDVSFDTVDVKEGETLSFGAMSFTVIETPGHTPGGVCYYDAEEEVVFTGDTLFAGAIGRTDGPHGDCDHLIVGIMDKVMGLPGQTRILPGHGPASDIGYERTHNPFLQPFNEPGGDDIDFDEDGIGISGDV